MAHCIPFGCDTMTQCILKRNESWCSDANDPSCPPGNAAFSKKKLCSFSPFPILVLQTTTMKNKNILRFIVWCEEMLDLVEWKIHHWFWCVEQTRHILLLYLWPLRNLFCSELPALASQTSLLIHPNTLLTTFFFPTTLITVSTRKNYLIIIYSIIWQSSFHDDLWYYKMV